MRALFWVMALFLLAALLAIAGHYNQGYALFVLPPYRVEIALNLLMLLALAGVFLCYALLRLLVTMLRMPHAVRAFRVRKRREKASAAFRSALRQLFEGRFGHALKQAAKAFKGGEDPALSAMVAARAAHGIGDEQQKSHWFAVAAQYDGGSPAARLMTQAELDLDAQRYDAALEHLDAVQGGGTRHMAASRLALRAHQSLGHWDEVLRVTRSLEKHRGIGVQQAESVKALSHVESLAGRGADAGQIIGYWNDMPAAERRNLEVARAAAKALVDAGDSAGARKIIEKQLDATWDAALVELYAQCADGEALERISRAEKWLKGHPQDATLLLSLGRLCRRQQLWGKAQSYFEASLAVEAGRAAHVELATLLDQLERPEEANRHFRAAASL